PPAPAVGRTGTEQRQGAGNRGRGIFGREGIGHHRVGDHAGAAAVDVHGGDLVRRTAWIAADVVERKGDRAAEGTPHLRIGGAEGILAAGRGTGERDRLTRASALAAAAAVPLVGEIV
ncbi:MAG: hypothetical protein ACK55I_17850, partial [bacterium]